MSNDIIKAGTGYLAGQALANNIAYNLRRQAEEREAKIRHITPPETLKEGVAKFILSNKHAEGYEWLNECIQTEMIGYAKKQEDTNTPLRVTIHKVREKYAPFYEKIGKEMPETIATLTADALCDLLDITNFEKRREAALAQAREMQEQVANQDTNDDSGSGCAPFALIMFVIAVFLVSLIMVVVVTAAD